MALPPGCHTAEEVRCTQQCDYNFADESTGDQGVRGGFIPHPVGVAVCASPIAHAAEQWTTLHMGRAALPGSCAVGGSRRRS
eukprot:7955420-Alexandrium_andersonii.AAC.1